MNWLWMSLYHAAAMFWETAWALVFGFAVSGVLQVLVSKENMSRWFGRTNLRSMALATGLGAASSSCSYAATAAARSAFRQGAALIPALAFMFASTNLVVELGAVLWLWMGPLFVAAEVAGALFLVGWVWLLGKWLLTPKVERAAREHAENAEESNGHCCHHHVHDHVHDHGQGQGQAQGHGHDEGESHDHQHHHHPAGAAGPDWRGRLEAVAHAFVMDWSMLWKEMAIGFLIAGFLATLVPQDWWKGLFLQGGPAWLQAVENAFVGPLIAMASFVCSVGNIPLASVLWSGGISFGGVASFIYGDLIVIPLLLIYRKYYGNGPALRITVVLFLAMVLAGLSVDALFHALHLVPAGPRPASAATDATFAWNHTAWLNLLAIALGAFLLYLHRRGSQGQDASGHNRHGHGHEPSPLPEPRLPSRH
ncbi:MAG: permease [Verrucomicrobia bacterium]|nr:permease [Verrucomicrobiota bacterium]